MGATETLADDTTRTTTTRTDGTTWVKDETAAGAVSITYTFTLDTAVARGASYDTDGNLVMPASLWNDGYFHNLRVDVAHFNAGVREDANAAIDVLGRTDVVDKNVKLESVFNTDYDANSATVLDSTLLDGAAAGTLAGAFQSAGTWDHTADMYGQWSDEIAAGSILQEKTVDKFGEAAITRKALGSNRYDGYIAAYDRSNGMDRIDAATLVAEVDPIKPRIDSYTFLYADKAGDVTANMEWSDTATPNTPIDTLMGSMNSGWRFPLTNNSNYALDSARVTLGTGYVAAGDDKGASFGTTGSTGNVVGGVANYDGGDPSGNHAIYGELVDGQWRGFDAKTLYVNGPALAAILAGPMADAKAAAARAGEGDFEHQSDFIAPEADLAGLKAMGESDVKAMLAGYTVDIYAVGRADTTFSRTTSVNRMQGDGSFAAETITVPTVPAKPIHQMGGAADTTASYTDGDGNPTGEKVFTHADGTAKYQPLALADYVTRDAAGNWVVSIPSEAWLAHDDGCTAKDGIDHNDDVANPNHTACKDELYVTRVTFHLPGFAAKVTQADPTAADAAVIEMHGVPTRATVMSLDGQFSTEYKTESWNANKYTRTIDGDYAKMNPLTAEPEIQTYFNWTGGKTGEGNIEVDQTTHRPLTYTLDTAGNKVDSQVIGGTLYRPITNVPYRWGEGDFSYLDFGNGEGEGWKVGQDHATPRFTDTLAAPDKTSDNPREDAWYEYILTNKSKSTAENGYLDLAIDGVSMMKVTKDANGTYQRATNEIVEQARGFIADELQIDGYYRYRDGDATRTKLPADTTVTSTKWTNRAGTVSKLWLYGCSTVVPHASSEDFTGTDGQKYRRSVNAATGEVEVTRLSDGSKTVTAPVATVTLDDATIELLVKNGGTAIDFTTAAGTDGASVDEAIAHLPLTEAGLAALKDAGASIKLREDADGAFDYEVIANVRLLYNSMAAELYEEYPADGLTPAKAGSNTTLTARIYGDVRTHGTPTAVAGGTVNTSYDNRMASTMYYFPLSSFYGNIDRASEKKLVVDKYLGASEAAAFKDAASRPTNGATSVSTPEWVDNGTTNGTGNGTLGSGNSATVSVANKADGAGYTFTLRNATRARSDAATLSMRIESVSMKAKAMLAPGYAKANAGNAADLDTNNYYGYRGVVRGFKTAELEIGTALKTMGQLDSIDLTFYQPNGEKFIITVPADSALLGADGAATTLNFHDAWNSDAAGDTVVNAIDGFEAVGLVRTPSGDAGYDATTTVPTVAGKSEAYTAANYTGPIHQNTTAYTIDDCYLYQVDFHYDSLEPSWRPGLQNSAGAEDWVVQDANGNTTANSSPAASAASWNADAKVPASSANNGYADPTDAAGELTVTATGKADWYNSVGNTATYNNSWSAAGLFVNGTDKTLTPCVNGYRTYYSTSSNGTRNYNWYYPHNQTLHARLFLKQKGSFDTRGARTADWQDNSAVNSAEKDKAQSLSRDYRYDTVRKCAALSVARPYMEVHSYVRYGNVNNYTGKTVSESTAYASDGTRTEVSVPYAKTFNYWATLKNESGISKLDDTDVNITFPVEWETFQTGKASVVGNNGKTSAYTGFHPIGYTISRGYLKCFPDDKVGKIRIFGYSPYQISRKVAQTSTTKVVLWPYYTEVAGKKRLAGFELEYATGTSTANRSLQARGALSYNSAAVSEATLRAHGFDVVDGRVRIPLQANGSFLLTEQQVYDMGIEVPTMFQLYSWKDMAEDMAGKTVDDQNVFIQGYTDSNFETQRTINIATYNHLDSFREAPLDLPAFDAASGALTADGNKANYGFNGDKVLNGTADNYTLSRIDRSLIFVSKMYFDAVSRSAYADVDSGEVVEDKNDENENKSLFEKIVDTLFEIDPDPRADGVAFYRYDAKAVHDGYVAVDDPAALVGGATQAYVRDEKGAYQKVTVVTVPGADGAADTLGYRTDAMAADATPIPAEGVAFFT